MLAPWTIRAYWGLDVTNHEQNKETDDVSGAARAAGDDRGDDQTESNAAPALLPPAPPQEVSDLAAACVRFVAARYRVTLDFTAETLSLVDQWVRDARAEVAARPEALGIVQAAAGAYLGEVIRRAFGGHWLTRGNHADWRVQLEHVYCAFNPIGMAREALLMEAADGWHAHLELDPGERDAVEQRLAALPAVEPDDYYAPSTRFDVVAMVVDALREDMRARGVEDVRFHPEDYD